MKPLYEASNSLEAHMIVNLLEQRGLSGRVDGEFLQGGIGELPAAGLVRVMVEEEDYPAAKEIVEEWDSAQPSSPTSTPAVQNRSGGRIVFLMIGLLAGALCTYTYFRAPVSDTDIDHNADGKADEILTYSPSGRVIKSEVDRDFDGKNDYAAEYNNLGATEVAHMDDDFDGKFETQILYREGSPYLTEVDTDGDGFKDFKMRFEHGVLASNEYIHPTSGKPEKIEYFRLGKITHSEIDRNRDGKMDQRKTFNALGEIESVVEIK